MAAALLPVMLPVMQPNPRVSRLALGGRGASWNLVSTWSVEQGAFVLAVEAPHGAPAWRPSSALLSRAFSECGEGKCLGRPRRDSHVGMSTTGSICGFSVDET